MKKLIIAAAVAVFGLLGALHAAQPVSAAVSCCDGSTCCTGGACCAGK